VLAGEKNFANILWMYNLPTHFEPGPWKEISSDQGIRTLEATNFEAFFHFVNRFGSGGTDDNYLWRGQKRSEWEIKSTLARASKAQYRDVHLSRFVHAIARSSEFEPDLSDPATSEKTKLKLWSLGQHWGLLTPLIDFTVYPYFALFFAFAKSDPGYTGSRAVFALDAAQIPVVNFEITEVSGIQPFREKLDHPPYDQEFSDYLMASYGRIHREMPTMVASGNIADVVKERICKIQFQREKEKELKLYVPGSSENKRIHAQGGWHAYTSDDVSVETWVRRHYKTSSTLSARPMVTKILIPNSERESVLTSLNEGVTN